jgi:acetyl esterase/lipase
MSQLVFLRHLVRHAPKVAVSRVLRGPGRPSWSFRFELFTRALKATSFEITRSDWAGQRVGFEALRNTWSPALTRVVRTSSVLGGVPTTTFTPQQPPKLPMTILYFHGGGYVFGSALTHADLVSRIALASPARAFLPEYRLAPESPFPAAIEDAVAVYRALLDRGVDPKRLVVAGDSAGGGLTMALLLRLKGAAVPMPAGAALICPWVDLTAAGGSISDNAEVDWGEEDVAHEWIAAYLAGHDPRDPLASPALADLSGLPPLLVQVGSAEMLLDQATLLALRAKESGVDARLVIEPDMVHNWHTFASFFSHLARSIDDIGAFAREVTGT